LVNNAEQVRTRGAEANGTFVLGHGLTANASATYVDADYVKYTHGSCYFGEAPNNGAGGCLMTGDDLPLTPHWRTSLGAQYKAATPLGGFYSRVDWVWQSSMVADDNLDPRSLQAAYSLVNARVGIKTDSKLDLSLWANNLFNTTYTMQDAPSNLFGISDPAFQRYLGRPRELGVTLRKSF
jgi:iron complex outermembrane receptor protein